MIHWLVLTGGASSRFGQDKASTEFAGRSLLSRSVDSLQALDVTSPISIVGPERSGGPAAATVSMLPEVNEDFVGVLAVDMPFAQQALAEVIDVCRSQQHEEAIDAWVPLDPTGRQQWLCAVYRRTSLIEAAGEQHDWFAAPFYRLVGGLATSIVPVESGVSLLDIDTPQDFQRAVDVATELRS